MERYSSRTIDELGRIVLHNELREKLNLSTNDKFYLKLVDTLLILQRTVDKTLEDCTTCAIDELGRVNLPNVLRKKLCWDTSDKVAVYHTDNLIILKLA